VHPLSGLSWSIHAGHGETGATAGSIFDLELSPW
jgi:hypothetical protein